MEDSAMPDSTTGDSPKPYDQFKATQLFSDEDILKIQQMCDNFDNKISQPKQAQPPIRDYVEYIKYKQSLITTVKERAKENRTPAVHVLLLSIADGIRTIYIQALADYPNNLRFWDEYIKFLQTAKYNNDISNAFKQMLQFHSNNLEAWIRAIRWEYSENFEYERVKHLINSAQELHPDAESLYTFLVRIELENKQESPKIEALQNADNVYMKAKQKITNVDFFIKLLEIADKYDFTGELQEKILADMETMFNNKEIVWHIFAQRALNGLFCPGNMNDNQKLIKTELFGKLNIKTPRIENSQKKRIENCSRIYSKAVKMIDTQKMWSYYINTMVELNNDLTNQASLKRLHLKQAFEGSNYLQEDHYVQYLEILHSINPKDETIAQVFQKSTRIYKNSKKLWLYYMRYYIIADNFQKLEEIFKETKILGGNGVEIWRTYLIYLRSRRREETDKAFDNYLDELARQQHHSFNILKAQMVELLATESMDKARKLYEHFTKHQPKCYEVHEMMAELESKQLDRDREREKLCLDQMIKIFGTTRADVWLRYMRYEQTETPERVNELHEKALETLKPELLAEFDALYTNFVKPC